MRNELHNELLRSIFQFKRITFKLRPSAVSKEDDMSLTALTLLFCIKENNGYLSGEKIRQELSVSKPAVSQMLAVLEKKGFISRETDKENRRCILLSLTEKGEEYVERTERETEEQLSGIISRFGEKETREMIALIDRFSDVIKSGDSEEECS